MIRRLHLRPAFWLFCLVTVLVGLAATNTGLNLLYWVLAAMLAALLVSGAFSMLMVRGIEVRRIVDAHAVVGEPFFVRYAVRNRGRLVPLFSVHCDEQPAGGAHGWESFVPGVAAWVMHAGPRERVHGEAVLRPTRRGEMRFDRVRAWTDFPFGLVVRSVTESHPQHALVWPRTYTLRRHVLAALEPAGPVGTRITRRAGPGDDFHGLREHREGDSLRNIAWKRTANRETLLCIERTAPSPPRIRLLLDLVHAGEGAERRRLEEQAISLAGSIVLAGEALGYEVGLTVLGLDEAPLPIRRGLRHRNRMMAALAALDLERPRTASRGVERPIDAELAGVVAVHVDRIDPSVAPPGAVHLSARQLPRLVEEPVAEDAS